MNTGRIADPMLPRPFRIRRKRVENADTFTLELEPTNGAGGTAFEPGQFNMLYVFGIGEVPISISGNPAHPQMVTHTTRAVGTVTREMAKLKTGDMLGLRGPFGSSWPMAETEGRDVVIVAGGIGLAPLRSALYRLISQRKRRGRVVLIYGARTPEDMIFPREIERWRASGKCGVHVTVDRTTGSWHGNVGVVTALIPRVPFDPHTAIAMICGPEIMMRFTVRELQRRGVSDDRIFVSMERNMKCAIGFCGHCQFGPEFICKNGPVFRYDRVKDWLAINEL